MMLKMISGLLAGLLSLVTRKPLPKTPDSTPPSDPPSSAAAGLTLDSIRDSFTEVEMRGLRPARVFMNIGDYCELRKLCGTYDSACAPPETGTALWGAEIIVSKDMPPGTVHVCADPHDGGPH